MLYANRRYIWSVFLILIVLVSLLNANVVFADDSTPTPPPTGEATQPPVEQTETPTPEETTLPTEPAVSTEEALSIEEPTQAEEETEISDVIAELPENTEVVVLDEFGNPIPLASQAAAEAILEIDPMWCPEGVQPGGVGCSPNFATIDDLRNDMISNTASYSQNGVIYFTATAGASLNFQESTLTGGSYNVLKSFNLTFQGGWNGSTVSPAFSGQTNFANNRFIVGSNANPWVGNITLKDLTFSNGNNTAISVITSNGSITLDNVDVTNQIGNNAASLTSTSGNITIQNNSVFDGDDFNGNGVTATTGSGSITITDATFTQFKRFFPSPSDTWDGLTLSAPTVTLTNVIATQNDGDGISISNANIVTLNNVTSSNNGTELGASGLSGNDGSGVLMSGPAGSRITLLGGTFNNNQEYGVEIGSPANTTLYLQSAPTCTGNDSNDPPTSSCYNVVAIPDGNGPVISPMPTIIQFADYDYGKVITYATPTTYDAVDGPGVATCSPPSGSTFAIGTSIVTCTATDNAGNISTLTFAVIIKVKTTGASEGTLAGGSPIAVTGNEVFDLTCPMSVNAFGVVVTFHNLCGYQAAISDLNSASLPASLPDGYTFVNGLDVRVLDQGTQLDVLPVNTGIELDFPSPGTAEYMLMYWDGLQWLEITEGADAENLTSLLANATGNELYRLNASTGHSKALTTEHTGTFVLAKK